MIQVIQSTTCPECDGEGRLEVDGTEGWHTIPCTRCRGTGSLPQRVLATLPDREELREQIADKLGWVDLDSQPGYMDEVIKDVFSLFGLGGDA